MADVMIATTYSARKERKTGCTGILAKYLRPLGKLPIAKRKDEAMTLGKGDRVLYAASTAEGVIIGIRNHYDSVRGKCPLYLVLQKETGDVYGYFERELTKKG